MALATDVRLERGATPAFPDVCCRCLRPQPEDVLVVRGRRSSWLALLVPWAGLAGRVERHEIPVCAECRAAAGRQRWRHRGIVIANLAVAIVVLVPLVERLGLERTWRKPIFVGGALLALAPAVLWIVFHPPVVDLTVAGDHVQFEFANADYARRFAAANGLPAPADS